jgi:hypothetical protein
MKLAWPGVTVDPSNLRVQIAALRKILSCSQDGMRAIGTVSVRGYCFTIPVSFQRMKPEISFSVLNMHTSQPSGNAERSSERASCDAKEKGLIESLTGYQAPNNDTCYRPTFPFEQFISQDSAALLTHLTEFIAKEITTSVQTVAMDRSSTQIRSEEFRIAPKPLARKVSRARWSAILFCV